MKAATENGPSAAEAPEQTVPAPLVEAEITERRYRWVPSMIWLLPLLAALIGAVLTYRELTEHGALITVSFKTAEGLEAGKSRVRYKDVEIGTVQKIRLAQDRSHVNISIRLHKDASGFQAEDTRYWVVRPRADLSGVSGLSTLLSGSYIGADAGKSASHVDHFVGLDEPPPIKYDESGSQFTLKADDLGSMDIGSPVLYRQVVVGRVTGYGLDEDGEGVSLRIFIASPYDRFVGSNTRFWKASGVNAKFDSAGINVHVESLLAVVVGGIAFASPPEGRGEPADQATPFRLAHDRESALAELDGPSKTLVLDFDQSLRGLRPGALVDFRGVVLGEVKAIHIDFDEAHGQVSMPVLIEIYPGRLSSRKNAQGQRMPAARAGSSFEEDIQYLQKLVDRGLRAQLQTGNLLTGQLFVALDFFPNAKKVKVGSRNGWIEMPTIANPLDEFQTQVSTLLDRLNRIPFEEIGIELKQTLAGMRRTLHRAEGTLKAVNRQTLPGLDRTIDHLRQTLDSAERMLDNRSPLQEDLRHTLNAVARAADSLRRLTDYLEQHPETLIRGKPQD